jgi:hypothetical protein
MVEPWQMCLLRSHSMCVCPTPFEGLWLSSLCGAARAVVSAVVAAVVQPVLGPTRLSKKVQTAAFDRLNHTLVEPLCPYCMWKLFPAPAVACRAERCVLHLEE